MYRDELIQIAQTVGESMLELELIPMPGEQPNTAEALAARVEISGAWNGCVVATCGEPLARKLAGILLQSEPNRIGSQHVRDALAEIANMLGGSIKALLAGPSVLSLPSVMSAREAAANTACKLLDRVWLDCGSGSLQLELWQASPGVTTGVLSLPGSAASS